MKRTNLIIDEQLLAEAKRLLGAETQSETVNRALAQAIKIQKVRNLMDFFGAGAWSGDLTSMREDKVKAKRRGA
jgi:Arc/MetJ family transcription regulator